MNDNEIYFHDLECMEAYAAYLGVDLHEVTLEKAVHWMARKSGVGYRTYLPDEPRITAQERDYE